MLSSHVYILRSRRLLPRASIFVREIIQQRKPTLLIYFWLLPWSSPRFPPRPLCDVTSQIPWTGSWAVCRSGARGRSAPAWSRRSPWNTPPRLSSGSRTRWRRRTRPRSSWEARSGATPGGWEAAAQVEAVEEGPSGRGAGPGEVCPACGTFPGTTEEAETGGVDSETTEAIKPRLCRGSDQGWRCVSRMDYKRNGQKKTLLLVV